MRFCTAEESRLFSKIGRFNSCTMVDNGWYKALSKNGSVMGAFAANVLARIVFNYRLADKKAPDGTVRKAFYFDGDMLQISYKTLSDAFSVSVASIKSAFDVLEEAGLVNREFRTVVMCGRKCPNTMFVSLNVERLISVSSFKGDGDGIGTTAGNPVHGMTGGDVSPFEAVSTYSFTLPYGGMEDAAMPDTAKEIPGTVSEIFTGGMPKKSDTCANDLTDQDINKINKNNNINNFIVSQSVNLPVNIQSSSLTGHDGRPDGLYDDTPSKRDGDDTLSSFRSAVGYEGLLLSYPGKKDLLDYIILVAISDCKEVLNRLCRENIESVLLGLSDRSDLSRIKNLQRYVAKAVKNSVGECLIKRAVGKTAGTACFGGIETAMRPQERHGGLYGAGGDMGALDGMGGRASFVLDGGKGIRYGSSGRGSRNDKDGRRDKSGRRPRYSWERVYTPEEYDEIERRLLSC